MRIAIARGLWAVLVVVQVAAYALSPYAEARASGAAGAVITIEAAHSDACVVAHRPDDCLACQLLTGRSLTPRAPVLAVAALEPVAVDPAALEAADTGATGGTRNNSRAPPRSAA